MARLAKKTAGSFVWTDNAMGHSISSRASCRVFPSGSKECSTIDGAIAYLTVSMLGMFPIVFSELISPKLRNELQA